jgi:hypothetical protein
MALGDIETKPSSKEYREGKGGKFGFDKAFPGRKKKPYEKTRKKSKRIFYR